jgi:hypothetical protein
LRDLGVLAVEVISADVLLKSAVFLLVWYLLIWSLLRWSTRARVDRLLARWKRADSPDDQLNLTTQSLAWLEALLDPIRRSRITAEDLANRVQALTTELAEESRSAA